MDAAITDVIPTGIALPVFAVWQIALIPRVLRCNRTAMLWLAMVTIRDTQQRARGQVRAEDGPLRARAVDRRQGVPAPG